MIDRIYDETIDTILTDIDEEYVDKVKEGYREYLQNRYSSFVSDPSFDESKLPLLIKVINDSWDGIFYTNKMSEFINDEAFNKLNYLSHEIYGLAREKLYNGYEVKRNTSKEEIDTVINNFTNLANSVEFFNRDRVRPILSETILDYLYVYTDTDDMSLRIGREYEHLKKMNELKKKGMSN